MDEQLLTTVLIPMCSSDEVVINVGDCVEEGVEEWLEDEAYAGFRVWHLVALVMSGLLVVTIALCCCVRFRVPRTKQEIEANYIRKKITRHFAKELAKISNGEMDEMDLQKALERVRYEISAESQLIKDNETKSKQPVPLERSTPKGFRARLNAILRGMSLMQIDNQQSEFINTI